MALIAEDLSGSFGLYYIVLYIVVKPLLTCVETLSGVNHGLDLFLLALRVVPMPMPVPIQPDPERQ